MHGIRLNWEWVTPIGPPRNTTFEELMIRSVKAAVAFVLVAGTGCSTFPGITDGDRIPVTRFRAEPYSFTSNSGIFASERILIRDVESWRATWAEIFQGHSSAPELPQVNFAQEMVVVAALGSRPTGGFGILIDGANEAGSDGTLIRVRTIAPGPRCGTTQAFTAPVDLARLARREGEVRFVDRAEVHTCD